jgi:hypothetical protein
MSINGQMDMNMVLTDNGIFFSITMHEILCFVTTGKGLEDNMVSEISQIQKDIHSMSPHTSNLKKLN